MLGKYTQSISSLLGANRHRIVLTIVGIILVIASCATAVYFGSVAIVAVPIIAVLIYFAAFMRPTLGILLFMAPAMVRSQFFELFVSPEQASALQKLFIIMATFIIITINGVKRHSAGALSLIEFYISACILTILTFPGRSENQVLAELVRNGATSALFGYLFPVLFLIASWKRISKTGAMRMVQIAPFMIIVLGAVFQVAGYQNIIWLEYTGISRLAGSLAPAYLASFGMFSVFASLWLWQMGDKKSLWLGFASLAVVLLTGTRGPAVIAVFLAIAVVLFGSRNGVRFRPRVRASVLVFIALVAAFAAPGLISRVSSGNNAEDWLSGRGYAWSYFWRFVSENPLFGNGIGAFSKIPEYSGDWYLQYYFVYPHNTYLQYLVDFGWLGMLTCLIIFFMIFAYARRENTALNRFMLGLLGISMLTYAYFDNLLAAPQPAVVFVVLIAALSRDETSYGTGVQLMRAEDGSARYIDRKKVDGSK